MGSLAPLTVAAPTGAGVDIPDPRLGDLSSQDEHVFVHGHNLAHKLMGGSRGKYADNRSQALLGELVEAYRSWRAANLELSGHSQEVVETRVRLLNQYKDLVDAAKYAQHFDSRSNLASSVIEEFLYYLLRDAVPDRAQRPDVGKGRSFRALHFSPPSWEGMARRPGLRMEHKDHDFMIGTRVSATFQTSAPGAATERVEMLVPAVAVECKTYLDKTMLEGAAGAAADLKAINPNAMYVIVAEYLKLTESLNLNRYRKYIDQIYVLRRQKNTDQDQRLLEGFEKEPIHQDLVWHLFGSVRHHLTESWELEGRLERGLLL